MGVALNPQKQMMSPPPKKKKRGKNKFSPQNVLFSDGLPKKTVNKNTTHPPRLDTLEHPLVQLFGHRSPGRSFGVSAAEEVFSFCLRNVEGCVDMEKGRKCWL